jgi:hypothetical protein
MLAGYIAADPIRRQIFDNIRFRLDPASRVGDLARFYVVRCARRRAVLRGILLTTGQRLPDWVKETPAAAEANQQFVADHRDAYNAFRREVRHTLPA